MGTVSVVDDPLHSAQKLMGHARRSSPMAEYYTEASEDVVEAVRLAFAGCMHEDTHQE